MGKGKEKNFTCVDRPLHTLCLLCQIYVIGWAIVKESSSFSIYIKEVFQTGISVPSHTQAYTVEVVFTRGISCCHVCLLAQGVTAEVVGFALFLVHSRSLLRERDANVVLSAMCGY